MSEINGNDVHKNLTFSEIAQTKLIEFIAIENIQFNEQYNIENPYKGIDKNNFCILENNTSINNPSKMH